MNFKNDCIFCKIANKQIPSEIVEETEDFVVIKDINPVAPIHLLIISKVHYDSVLDVGCKGEADKNADDGNKGDMKGCVAGKELFGILNSLARKFGVADKGFRTVINTKEDGGQTVNHLHIHFMAGRGFGWPPG
ncbi:MAG: HIT domain-containing protein [Candidatus Acidulodesulfobacterium sp.]